MFFMEKIVDFLYNIVFFNVFSLFGFDKNVNLPFCIFVLLIGYVVLMFRLDFIQFTRITTCFKYSFLQRNKNKQVISPLKILITSIAGCTGMNTTAGIVFMIAVGGVGTVFWIPIITILCMAFRFAEVFLSHHYRTQKGIKNEMLGGPFDYIKKGLGEIGFKKLGKILAVAYACLMIITGAVGVSMYEMNQSVVVLEKGFSFLEGKRVLLSFLFTAVAIFIIIGGTKRISNFFSVCLPVLAVLYFLASLIVICVNYDKLGYAVSIIYQDAMHPRSMAGGWIASICMCARKCSMSHETGLGTSGIVHALSEEKDSIKEATRSMMTPIISGILISICSALVLIITDVYKTEYVKDGVVALTHAFGSVNILFSYIVMIIIPMFTFNVLTAWSNYIYKCSNYVFNNKKIIYLIMAVLFACAFCGGIIDDFITIVNFVDIFLMLIVLINVPVVIALSGIVRKELKGYKFK